MGEERLSNLSLYAFTVVHLDRLNPIVGSLLVSSAVDRGFEPRSGQTKDYEIGIFCISAKHAA
jgi:hypothetical protein